MSASIRFVISFLLNCVKQPSATTIAFGFVFLILLITCLLLLSAVLVTVHELTMQISALSKTSSKLF